jgi:phosphatidate cytidylyltransferase
MLKYRVVSSFVLSAAVLAMVTILPTIGAILVLLCFAVFAQREFYILARKCGIAVYGLLGIICGVVIVLVTCVGPLTCNRDVYDMEWTDAVMVACVIAVFIRQFPAKHNAKPLETIGCTLLGILYVPYLISYIARLLFRFDDAGLFDPIPLTGKLCFIYLIVVTKSADTGAYFIGRHFGRSKLFPRISPAKTWEGLCGGIGTALVASLLFWVISDGSLGNVRFSAGDSLALGGILTIAGAVGDLFESLIKRSSNAKDSSNIIPGMGGLLDVLDSLLFAAPVLYLYVLIFL